MRIGYHPKELIQAFTMYFIKVFGVVAAVGLILFFVLKHFLDEMFLTGGIYLDTTLSLQSILALAISYMLFSWSSYRTASKGIFKEY
jgi:Na+-transporting NADH:ubiquinone oxidoreductase subunit NqrE